MKNTIAFTALLASLLLGVSIGRAADIITGAGATFPAPLYQSMFSEYGRTAGVSVDYNAVGSGMGVKFILRKSVDFGASDFPIADDRLSDFDSPVLHIPISMGAVVVSYNLPGMPRLKLTPEIIAGIYLGSITFWNDPQIVAANPAIELPSLRIVPIYRSDASGTSFIVTDYLSKSAKLWAAKAGKGMTLTDVVGICTEGNNNVAKFIENISGSIGYLELSYAFKNGLMVAGVMNKTGHTIIPSVESVSEAANIDIPDDTRVSITGTDAVNGYPISGFTWLVVYREQSYNNRTEEQARALARLLWWMTHDGQQLAPKLNYAPLHPSAVAKAEKLIRSMTYKGKPLTVK